MVRLHSLSLLQAATRLRFVRTTCLTTGLYRSCHIPALSVWLQCCPRSRQDSLTMPPPQAFPYRGLFSRSNGLNRAMEASKARETPNKHEVVKNPWMRAMEASKARASQKQTRNFKEPVNRAMEASKARASQKQTRNGKESVSWQSTRTASRVLWPWANISLVTWIWQSIDWYNVTTIVHRALGLCYESTIILSRLDSSAHSEQFLWWGRVVVVTLRKFQRVQQSTTSIVGWIWRRQTSPVRLL